MLGWFKKKLSGRKEEAAVEETAAQADVQIDAQLMLLRSLILLLPRLL